MLKNENKSLMWLYAELLTIHVIYWLRNFLQANLKIEYMVQDVIVGWTADSAQLNST